MSKILEGEIAFTLPKAEVKKVIFRSSAMIFMILTIMLIGLRIELVLDIALLLAIFHVASYYFLIHHKYIFVAPKYFRGESFFGRVVIVGWNENVIDSKTNHHGLVGYKLKKDKLLNFIFLPKAIAESDEFQSAIAKFAPKSHLLLSLKSDYNSKPSS